MTLRLLLANVLELAVGVGVVTMLRLPLGAAYLAGLAVVGIVSAHLALVHVTIGWLGLAVMAAVSLGLAYRERPRLRLGARAGWIGAAALGVLLVRAWPTFAAKPLDDYDAWAIWGVKAKALYFFGWADPAFFTNQMLQRVHLDYPLLLPSLEAVAARAMGGFDPRLIHLQFLLLAVAGFAALHALLRDRVHWWLLWPALAAVAAAPAFSGQLLTAYADVPLALFVAAGLLAAARWLDDGSPRTLALATIFLGAAALTKSEGILFVGAAYLGLALASHRLGQLAVSACGFVALLAPWWIWLAVHHVPAGSTVNLTSPNLAHPGIGPLAFQALLERAFSLHAWPLLVPLFLAAVLAAAGARLAVFAWAWAFVSLLALTGVYVTSKLEWSNYFAFSGDRVVDSLVIGAAALTPLLAAEALRIARQ